MAERRFDEGSSTDRRKIPRFSDAKILSGVKSIKKWVFVTMICFLISAALLITRGVLLGVQEVGIYFFGAFFLIFFSVIYYKSFVGMRLFVNNESLSNLQKVFENQIGLFLSIAIASLVFLLTCVVALVG